MTEAPTTHVEDLLRKIGPKLRAAREAKDLTIQEVSSRTRINAVFLKQIEAGRTENLPGLTFVRGFIRNYLQVLELQDDEIESHLKQFSGLEQYKAETELGPKINEMHGDDDLTEVPVRRNIILALVVIFVVAVGYLGVRVISQPDEKELTPMAAGRSTPGQSITVQPSETPQAGDSPSAQVAQPDKSMGQANLPKGAPLASPQNLRLTVRGLEPTWIRLSIDRAPATEVRLEPAETMNWEANEEFRLVIGKSHGVAVYLNGEDILLPEERGQLIPDIVLNKLTLLRLEN